MAYDPPGTPPPPPPPYVPPPTVAYPTANQPVGPPQGPPPGQPPRSGGEPGRRLLLVSVLAALCFVGTYIFFVRTSVGQQLDNALLEGQEFDLESNVATAEDLLRSLTVGALFLGIAVAIAVPIVRRRPRLAFASAFIVGASMLANELLKEYILERPLLDDVPVYWQQNSFPSGHTTTAMVAGVALVLGVPHRVRGPAALLASAFAIVIGTATMRAAWHRLSDLIGSYLLVLTIAAGVLAVLAFWRGRSAPAREPGRPPPGWVQGVLAAVAFVGLLGGLSLCLGTLAVTVLQGEYDLGGARSVDVVALSFWVAVLSAGVLGLVASWSRGRTGATVVASGLTWAGLLALAGGAVALLLTWRELTVGFPGEVALLWSYRLATFAGHGVCFLALAALLHALRSAELDPPGPQVTAVPGPHSAAGPAAVAHGGLGPDGTTRPLPR